MRRGLVLVVVCFMAAVMASVDLVACANKGSANPAVVASNATAWTLVYANDSNGNATYGTIQTLIDAVMNGRRVRFIAEWDGSSPWAMDAQTIWVRYGKVYVQNTSNVQSIWQGEKLMLPSDNSTANIYFNLDTSGNLNYSIWLVGEHTRSLPDTQAKESIKWFVD